MFSERADIHMLKSGMKEVWVAYRFYPVGFSRFINFPKFSSSYTKVIDIFLVMNYKFPFTFSNFSQVSPNFRPIWSKTIFLQDFQISPYKIGNIMTFFSVRILINFPHIESISLKVRKTSHPHIIKHSQINIFTFLLHISAQK